MIVQRATRFVSNMLVIRRVEFRIAEIPILGIAAALSATSSHFIRTGWFWEGVVLFFVLFAFGDMINVLADRELDAVYKNKLSNAVTELGVRFVTAQVVAYALVAIALGIHLSFVFDRPMVLLWVVVGLALGSQYSVKPLHLKSAGVGQLLCLWAIIFVGPMALVATYFRSFPDAWFLATAIAYGGMQMGIILVNTAEDFPEDRAAGVRNTTVALGLHKGIALAAALVGICGAAHVGLAVSQSIRSSLPLGWYAPLVILALVWLAATTRLTLLANRLGNLEEAEAVTLVRQRAKLVPVALTLTAWPTLLWAIGMLVS